MAIADVLVGEAIAVGIGKMEVGYGLRTAVAVVVPG